MKRKYTDQEFIEAIKNHKSIRQVLQALHLKGAGGNYRSCHAKIKELKLNTSHFTGQGHNKGKKLGPKIPLDDYLLNKRSITSHDLRLRLLKEEIFKAECVICLNTQWNERPIPLELDHINGNHDDNRIENIRILCPNCHAQTINYRGKNKKSSIEIRIKTHIPKVYRCNDCQKEISSRAKRCKSCAARTNNKTKIAWPSNDKLLEMIQATNYSVTARKLGVSDTAIRKRLNSFRQNKLTFIANDVQHNSSQ